MFFDHLRLERTGSVAGSVQINATFARLKGLLRLAVLTIGHHIIDNMGLQFSFQCGLG